MYLLYVYIQAINSFAIFGQFWPTVHCSKSTTFRKMKSANKNVNYSKRGCKIEVSPYPYVIHFDGKTLYKINAGKKFKIDRLTVFVNIEGETHLLVAPPLP